MKKSLTISVMFLAVFTFSATSLMGAPTPLVINGNFCSVANLENPPAGLNSGNAEWNDLTSATGGLEGEGFGSIDSAIGAQGTGNDAVLNYTNGSAVEEPVKISWWSGSQNAHEDRDENVDNGHDELFAGYLQTGINSSVNELAYSDPAIRLSGSGMQSTYGGNMTSYDIYVYFDGDSATEGDAPFSIEMIDGDPQEGNIFWAKDQEDDNFIVDNTNPTTDDYRLADKTTKEDAVNADYAVFRGMTEDIFTIDLVGLTGEAGVTLSGFEIVATPEPSTGIILALLGALAFFRRPRRG